jgi:pantetheine-phosphate adenylyltransferase
MSIAIYPGSFDPPTLGHLDIVKRTAAQFDEVVVCVMNNSQKPSQMFTTYERVDLLKAAVMSIPNVRITTYSGLLTDYIKTFHRPIIIRGLRAMTDFEYEFQMALVNKKLDSTFETMFMVADDKYTYLSSSAVRELAKFGADLSAFVPAEIIGAIRCKIEGKGKQDPFVIKRSQALLKKAENTDFLPSGTESFGNSM